MMRFTHNLSFSVTDDNTQLDVAIERKARAEASDLFVAYTHRRYTLLPGAQITAERGSTDPVRALLIRAVQEVSLTLDGTPPFSGDEGHRPESVITLTPTPAAGSVAAGTTNDAVLFVSGGPAMQADPRIMNGSGDQTAEVEVFFGYGSGA